MYKDDSLPPTRHITYTIHNNAAGGGSLTIIFVNGLILRVHISTLSDNLPDNEEIHRVRAGEGRDGVESVRDG